MSRKMKDSGIEWICDIPEHWKVSRFKLMFNLKRGLPITKENLIESGVPVVSYGQIHSKVNTGTYISKELIRFVSEEYIQTNPEALAQKGDFLFADTSEDLEGTGNFAYMSEADKIFAGYHTIIASPFTVMETKYFAYLFKTDCWRSQIRSRVSGIKLFSITQKILNTLTIILPDEQEQISIANYLDFRCTLIDQTIEKQKQVIEKLREYKQSVITEAVTKGLNLNVPMKDSGIEWIGEIPEHWKLIPFKHILHERNEKNNPIQTDERLSLSIDKGVTLYAEKTTNLDRYKDDVSQYKLAHIGDFVLNSMNMIVGSVGISDYFGCVSPAYYTYYDNEESHVTAKFCDFLFKSKTIKKVLFSLGKGIMAIDRGDDKINTCRLKVSRDDLRSLKLPLPNTTEQARIIRFLEEKCSEIDAAISVKQTVVDKLNEYKKSLIYECVTGKREVNNV